MLPRILIPLVVATLPLHAVIVAQGDGTQNTTAPVDDFGFANVGVIFDPADGIFVGGVYLGGGWVLSAYHGVRDASQTGFQFGDAYFGGQLCTVDASSATRLHTPGFASADLALFHLTSEPALPSVTIASVAPTDNLSLVMMGAGPSREATETHWIVNTAVNPYTWTETPLAGNFQGYKWNGSPMLRWGTNNITAFSGGDTTANADDGFGVTNLFKTNFTNTAGEGQAGSGDSGGGVFWKVGGQWQLGGILLATGSYSGQPAGTAVFGDETYAANLSAYRTEITSIVPEPSSAALLLGGATFALRRRRRA